MIVYNGRSGGVGRYLAPIASERQARVFSLETRLEDHGRLPAELDHHAAGAGESEDVTLLQLAAIVPIGECEKDPDRAHNVNVVQTKETVRSFVSWAVGAGKRPRVVYTSTSHVYAPADGETLIKEDHPCTPQSVYARTKREAEEQLIDLARQESFTLTIGRIFGILAPQQPETYLLPGILRRVAAGDESPVPGWNYSRDYLDARDVCHALLDADKLSMESPGVTIVNLCGGTPIQISEIYMTAARLAGRSYLKPSAAPGRPTDNPWLVGDATRFEALLGRRARTIAMEMTIRDALAERGMLAEQFREDSP